MSDTIKIFGKEFDFGPKNALGGELIGQGIKSWFNNDFKKSVDYLTLALELSPQNPSILTMRGISYDHLGETELALEDLVTSMKLAPDESLATFRVGMIASEEKNFELAVQLLYTAYTNSLPLTHNILANNSVNDIIFVGKQVICNNLGSFLVQAGNSPDALQFLDESILLDSTYPNPLCIKGIVIYDQGNKVEGIKLVKKAQTMGFKMASEVLLRWGIM